MFSSLRPPGLAAALLPSLAFAQFTLPPLPYAADALEPVIDKPPWNPPRSPPRRLCEQPQRPDQELSRGWNISAWTLQGKISQYNAAVRNNGGGHYNHDLFWKVMARPGLGGEPSAALKQAIDAQFGNLDELKNALTRPPSAALAGLGWLVVTADKNWPSPPPPIRTTR